MKATIYIICTIILFSIVSCKKTVENEVVKQSTYLRNYSQSKNQTGINIKSTEDGGMIVYVSEDLHVNNDYALLCAYTLDKNGKLISRNVVDSINPYFTNLSDGGTLFASTGEGILTKADKNGQVVFKCNYFKNNGYNFSYPLEVHSRYFPNHYMVTRTISNKVPSETNIDIINSSGVYENSIFVNNSIFPGHVLWMSLYKYEDDDIYYVYGLTFHKPNWSWVDNARFYVAKLQRLPNGMVILLNYNVLDPDNESRLNRYSAFTPYITLTGDGGFILVSSSQDRTTSFTNGYMTKVDSNLNVVWEHSLKLEGKEISIASIEKCRDNNYILCGGRMPAGKLLNEPYMCKINGDGDVIWKKFFPGPSSGYGWYATQLDDGSCVPTGSVNSFGNGLDGLDMFLFKTNKNGWIE